MITNRKKSKVLKITKKVTDKKEDRIKEYMKGYREKKEMILKNA